MNRLINIRTFAFILFSIVIVSCDNDDDDRPSGQFSQGIFVVNEGQFQKGDGSVTFFDRNGTATQDLFGLVNNGRALGDVVQSMTIADNRAYVVVNNSHRVEVVNANTFESLYTVNDVALPRFFTVHQGRGYVTEWVSFTDPGRVSVINLDTHQIVDRITTDFGAENILAHNGLLYVSNSFTTTVSVIDPSTNEVIKTIETGAGPGELLVDAGGRIWVVCAGSFGGDDGALVQLDPSRSTDPDAESVLNTIAAGRGIANKAAISGDGNNIFYYSANTVYKMAATATVAPADPIITEPGANEFYAIGIDPGSGVLYMGDPEGFVSSGTVFRYDLSGNPVDQFTTGIAPTDFAFHE